jgi:crotonobetainyl-CoA:carnitine CoA-transferase CaiB-like acyl-CoA transferase
MVIGAGNPKAWAGVCEVLGHPEWTSDPRFDHPQKRVRNRVELEGLIEAKLKTRDVADWCSRFDAAGVPAGPVNNAGQALEHPQTRAVGMVVDVPDGIGGMSRGIGSPITLSGKAEADTRPAPSVGQHSRELLRENGFFDGEIDDLVAAKVVA